MIKVNGDVLKVNGKGFRATSEQYVFDDGIAQVYTLVPTSRAKKGTIRMNSYVVEYLDKFLVVLAPYALERTDFSGLVNQGFISGIHTIPCKNMTESLETVALMA
jgi:hypothetical protein